MTKRPRGADLVLKAVASPTRPIGISPEESSQEDKNGVTPLSTPKRRLDMPSPTTSPVHDVIPSTGEAAGPAESCDQITKRTDYLKWDDYFMAVAVLSAQRSKDPSTQVGACVVNADNKIVGIGYNGFPIGCSDDELPWARSGPELDTKYPYVCHAEMNAIMNKCLESLKGCRIYVALFPCNDCTKLIIQSGIREVVYLSDKYHDTPSCMAARRMLELAKVVYRKHECERSSVTISLLPSV